MCNHYEKNAEVIDMAVSWALNAAGDVVVPDDLPELPDHTWPKALAPVLVQGGVPKLEVLRWGVRREVQGATKPLVKFVTNARDDKLSSWTWRYCVPDRRCLIPASAYYEPDGPVGGKWEVRFTLPAQPSFFFAGLWDADPDGATRAFTMVTTSPNELAAQIHDRMPLVLDDAGAQEWIAAGPLTPERLAALCRPYPAAAMQSAALPPPQKKIKSADLKPADGELLLE
jgi:putative SOS response-associated peptidase YedK